MSQRKGFAIISVTLTACCLSFFGSQFAVRADESSGKQETQTDPAGETKARSSHAAQLLANLSESGGSAPLAGNRIADIAEAAAPAVVNIEIEKPGSTGGLQSMLPFGSGNFRFFFNNKEVDPERMGAMKPVKATGSGFIVRPDGFILTNGHVVKGARRIDITLHDGRTMAGTIVGLDNFSDLAVVKIEAKNLPILKMGTSSNLRPGEFAVAIGSPMGYDHTVTLGIISAVGRTVYDINDNINFIQTDAAINTGNSGGPLLNLAGDVIGVNTAVIRNFVAQNIGFSIPVDVAKQVCDDLIAHKKVTRPWLGIGMRPVSETMAKSLGLSDSVKGVLVAQVFDGSPADHAGLKKDDIIQKIDGKDVFNQKDVRDYVRSKKIEDTLNFYVLRNGSPQAIAVHLGEFPDIMNEHPEPGEE